MQQFQATWLTWSSLALCGAQLLTLWCESKWDKREKGVKSAEFLQTVRAMDLWKIGCLCATTCACLYDKWQISQSALQFLRQNYISWLLSICNNGVVVEQKLYSYNARVPQFRSCQREIWGPREWRMRLTYFQFIAFRPIESSMRGFLWLQYSGCMLPCSVQGFGTGTNPCMEQLYKHSP